VELARKQLTLFGATQALPEGFRYQPEILSPEDEQSILERVRSLPFKEFEFQGFVGKRRTVSFGWRYDFNDRSLQKAEDIPGFLLSLREVAAEFAELPAPALQQVLVTEYDAGAAIGWHRDKKIFGDVVGISLLSACRFRFRRKSGSSWERAAVTAEPRSAYLLRGPSRTEWEHSIPAVEALRYSITYRSLLEPRSQP
jgi:alkylated DNA repair dioxygenase AlkB